MGKVLGQIKALAERFGCGVIVSSATYVNGLLVLTAGLACFLLCILFDMFGIQPGPPADSSNLISWALYLLCISIYGCMIWTYMASFLLFPLGFGLSVLDLIGARKSGNLDRYRGAVSGICLAAVPISFWYLGYCSSAAMLSVVANSLGLHFLPSAGFAHSHSVTTLFINHIR